MYKKLSKLMIVIIITFLILIITKKDENIKNLIYENVYKKNISFAKINNFYEKKFGFSLPNLEILNTKVVFNEKLNYKNFNKYKDGVELIVESNYLIPALDSGIVIFKGYKEGYGKTIIIQQENGIDLAYSNLNEINLNIYDYIKEGEIIGNVDEKLYLVFTKDGEVIDYKKYI